MLPYHSVALQFSIKVLLDIWPIWFLLEERVIGGAAGILGNGINYYAWWLILSSDVYAESNEVAVEPVLALHKTGSFHLKEEQTLGSHSWFTGLPVCLLLNWKASRPPLCQKKKKIYASHSLSRLFLEISEQDTIWGAAGNINMDETVGVLSRPPSEDKGARIPEGQK